MENVVILLLHPCCCRLPKSAASNTFLSSFHAFAYAVIAAWIPYLSTWLNSYNTSSTKPSLISKINIYLAFTLETCLILSACGPALVTACTDAKGLCPDPTFLTFKSPDYVVPSLPARPSSELLVTWWGGQTLALIWISGLPYVDCVIGQILHFIMSPFSHL
jgi:hypothetical protein